MRQRGTIRGWKDDKGFGFVTPLAGGEDAFVHINAFLNRQRRPVDGDEVSYEAVQDFQQRWQARAIRFADEAAPGPDPLKAVPEQGSVRASARTPRSPLPLLRAILVLLVAAVLVLAFLQLTGRSPIGSPAAQVTNGAVPLAEPALAHCPNTEMDGDGDGVAGEREWCDGEG